MDLDAQRLVRGKTRKAPREAVRGYAAKGTVLKSDLDNGNNDLEETVVM